MCGIVGGVWPDNQGDLDELFDVALSAIDRRGPDDRGKEIYSFLEKQIVFGHTRLSIIDLSSAGHQPMTSKCGRYHLIFNGEIYNYKELAEELEISGVSVKTDTDTEVLLLAWMQWGKGALRKMIGMFSFAVLDEAEGTITLVRDAFGIKPLFYMKTKDGFLFSSSIDSIRQLAPNNIPENNQVLYEYLVHGRYDQGEDTFLSGVSHVSPASLMVYDITTNDLSSSERWWVPSIEEKGVSFDEAVKTVRELFLNSIKLHLRSDVPVGVALSGGVDSSAIACAIRYLYPNMEINTFSYIAKGSELSEEYWVDYVNRHIGAKPHKVILDEDQLFEDIDSVLEAQGEPFGSTSIYAGFGVFREVKNCGIKVLLEGQGADELLAGYDGYPGQRLKSLVGKGKLIEAIRFLINWGKWPGRSRKVALQLFAAQVAPLSLYYFLRKISGRSSMPHWINGINVRKNKIDCRYPLVRPHKSIRGRRVVAELALSLSERGLPGLLRHSDRNAMYFSVENRVPFLTIELAEFLLSLPEEFLISRDGETKYVFREAMRGIVPDEVLDRRDKVGYEAPEGEWLKKHSSKVKKLINNGLEEQLVHRERVLSSFEGVVTGRQLYSWQVWRWVNYFAWISDSNSKKS